jgi:arginine decarboxylase
MVSANFVIPYPPGFPIMVPGQVIEADTIGFMRKLDVKEIHGYNNTRGLKLIKLSAIGKVRESAAPKKVQAAPASAAPSKKKSAA